MTTPLRYACALLAALAAAPMPAPAEEQREPGWYDTAELSVVATAGNAESTTFGFANTLRRVWEQARFKLEAAGLRAETTERRRRAVGVPESFRIIEEDTNRLSAESYLVRGRYERELSERLFWYAGAGWERNQFAGIENRTSLAAGAGHVWVDREAARFSTDYAVTYTDQENVVASPGGDGGFLGLRVSSELFRRLTETTTFESELIVDESLDDTSDLRADLATSLAVAISERLSLKVGLDLAFDNQPAFEAIPLETPAGLPTGDTVRTELENLDSVLKVALVVDF